MVSDETLALRADNARALSAFYAGTQTRHPHGLSGMGFLLPYQNQKGDRARAWENEVDVYPRHVDDYTVWAETQKSGVRAAMFLLRMTEDAVTGAVARYEHDSGKR